jgi:arginase
LEIVNDRIITALSKND